MEIKIQKTGFLKGLGLCQSIVERKNIMPILSNAYFEAAKDKKLTIIATDLEVGVRIDVEAEVVKEGRITVNAKKLNDIIKEMSSEEIKIKVLENNWVEIKGGTSKFKIVGMSTDEYPNLPDFDAKVEGEIPASILMEMIEKTVFSVSTDEARYNLGGIFTELIDEKGKKKLSMVATDGHRLSKIEREITVKSGNPLEKPVIIPRRGAEQIMKIIALGDGNVGFTFKENNGTITGENVILMMRLVDGEFPDYTQVVPSEIKKKIHVKRSDFLGALKRSNVLLSNKYRGVKLHIEKGKMTMVTNNPDLGENIDEIEIDYKGDKIEILFDVKYLYEITSLYRTEELVIGLNDSDSPGMITEKGDGGYIHVIMPMLI